jgi:hypothetical protein
MEASNFKNTKTIQINEDLFSTGTSGGKPKRNKTAKKPRTILDSTQIQKQLMQNIKKRNDIVKNRPDKKVSIQEPTIPHDKPVETPVEKIEPKPEPKPLNAYDESLQFMNTIASKPKKSSKRKSSPKQTFTSEEPSNISEPNTINLKYRIDSDIPHGCLKNGLKKTMKNMSAKYSVPTVDRKVTFQFTEPLPTNHIEIHNELNDPTISIPKKPITIEYNPVTTTPPVINLDNPETIKKEDDISEIEKESSDIRSLTINDTDILASVEDGSDPVKEITNVKDIPISIEDFDINTSDMSVSITPIEDKDDLNIATKPISGLNISGGTTTQHICKVKKTYRLGKHPTKRIVSVFCKNIEMINGIKRIHNTLRNTRLKDMKKYLIRRSLLSVGSPAPPDVIKQMYISALESGDITNHNEAVLLKNYIES